MLHFVPNHTQCLLISTKVRVEALCAGVLATLWTLLFLSQYQGLRVSYDQGLHLHCMTGKIWLKYSVYGNKLAYAKNMNINCS
jgi:hypothetical protein